jgi:hypothetical protein
MQSGAVGGRLLLAFEIKYPERPPAEEPGLANVARERSGGLAMLRPLCYEASKHLPIQQVRGPVAQPDRATVS